MRHLGRWGMWIGVAMLSTAGCGDLRSPAAGFRHRSPHAVYEESLRSAGLAGTALGREWVAAAARAVRQPAPMDLPFREEIYFAPETPGAAGYQLRLRRGERLVVDLALEGSPAPRLFVDLFRLGTDSAGTLRHELAADSAARSLVYEVDDDGTFILRVQPELLRGARVRISASVGATLAFPVVGRDSRAVRSFWGAARDAGQRSHQGIDIFAPRGTPAIAASEGWVTAVRQSEVGGNVVWLWDPERRQSLYYAHLDRQLVSVGERVRTGDTLGLVGNTGNARTTPPHLHFGIYRRGEGPIDPYRWVHQPQGTPPRIQAPLAALGALRRSGRATVPLRAGPETSAPTVVTLGPRTALRVVGAIGEWYRVTLPDGSFGYLPARSLEDVAPPLRTERLRVAAALRDRPAADAALVDSLPPGSSLQVLGQFSDFRLVQTRDGRMGWVTTDTND